MSIDSATARESLIQEPSTLLLVDDERSILSALRRALRPHGYRILTVESGAAGLEVLAAERVDLVISDMRMPEMDGAEFLEKARAAHPDVKRILLTGYADMTATIAAINRGEIYRYITKPWDNNELALIVRDALEMRRLEAENTRLLDLTRRKNEELQALNAGLEQRVRERTAELERSNRCLNQANERLRQNFLVTIKIFSSLIEMRQGTVGGHARRVAGLARKLAAQMELDARLQQDIFIAALLHDMGKIGFSDTLFAKPVQMMTPDEMAHYRKHSLAGANALMPLAELHDVAAIVRSHHERHDGQGFPDGLSGDKVPLGARILAIANDFDNLQSGTLSEKKYLEEEAFSTLVNVRGHRYDPIVLDAFMALKGQLRKDAVPQGEMEVAVEKLEVGMVLARDLLSRGGTLLLSADYVLDERLVEWIQRYAQREDFPVILHIRQDMRPEAEATT